MVNAIVLVREDATVYTVLWAMAMAMAMAALQI